MSRLYYLKLNYYNGMFTKKELDLYENSLIKGRFILRKNNISNQPVGFHEEFHNWISLVLSEKLIQAYILGLLSSGSYDVLKNTIIGMWNSLIGKTIERKIGNEEVEKEATFGLHVIIDNNTKIDIRLSGDVSDNDKNECIDKAFELIKNSPKNEKKLGPKYAKYNWEEEKWEVIDPYKDFNKKIERILNKTNEND